jgi:hypothetical protein
MTDTPMAVNPGVAAQTPLGGLTIVMIMAMEGLQGRRRECHPKRGFANTMKMVATAGRVPDARSSTVDLPRWQNDAQLCRRGHNFV